jgi:ribonuclease PH
MIKRHDGRGAADVRPVTCILNPFGYADGSVLLKLGKTQVYCAVTLQQGVPPFLRGQGIGWVTAEYSLLPTSTQVRKPRDGNTMKLNGRSVEISRLIGRVLRSVVNVNALGERTITIDCDVLQADGGTRTACITAAYIALRRATQQWMANGFLKNSILTDELAAISVGIRDNDVLLDVDYQEDNSVDADFNFVLTRSGSIIEVQGTAEKKPISWELFERARLLAQQGVESLCSSLYDATPGSLGHDEDPLSGISSNAGARHAESKAALFSLQNRQHSSSSSSR